MYKKNVTKPKTRAFLAINYNNLQQLLLNFSLIFNVKIPTVRNNSLLLVECRFVYYISPQYDFLTHFPTSSEPIRTFLLTSVICYSAVVLQAMAPEFAEQFVAR